MAMAFTRASWWLLGSGGKDAGREPNSSPAASSSRDADSARFPLGQGARVRSERPRPRWQSREERRRRAVDREFDLVLVPSDGGLCWSGSDSDDSDWSIGWLEPHAPGFLPGSGDGGGSATGSFAVLVPCYGRGRCNRAAAATGSSPNRDLAIGAMDFVDGYSSAMILLFATLLVVTPAFRDSRRGGLASSPRADQNNRETSVKEIDRQKRSSRRRTAGRLPGPPAAGVRRVSTPTLKLVGK